MRVKSARLMQRRERDDRPRRDCYRMTAAAYNQAAVCAVACAAPRCRRFPPPQPCVASTGERWTRLVRECARGLPVSGRARAQRRGPAITHHSRWGGCRAGAPRRPRRPRPAQRGRAHGPPSCWLARVGAGCRAAATRSVGARAEPSRLEWATRALGAAGWAGKPAAASQASCDRAGAGTGAKRGREAASQNRNFAQRLAPFTPRLDTR